MKKIIGLESPGTWSGTFPEN